MSTPKKTPRAEADRRAVQPLVWLNLLLDHRAPGKTPTVIGTAAALAMYANSSEPRRPIWPGNTTIDERLGLSARSHGQSAQRSIRRLRDWGFLVVVNPDEYPEVQELRTLDRRKLVYVLTTPSLKTPEI
ncbi:hypothetical protein JN535_04015 [Cellulosimicrobium cellulans]|uniref:hypothetical protein n=1 Tax=Cellulosimicrobium cellulans TaxID=1710 RepID=UPI0019652AD5|nr:hypothetical protein [Cellulosimicrobium cellulans]MBN0039339.1 hypothetical protein [Cellulosimicrobium cellulans]